MHLPGRLKATTLGDLLGALHREGAQGTLELVEDRGRVHRVHLAQGRVVAVEVDGAAPSLAEILRRERAADDDVLRRSLLRALSARRLHGEVLVSEFHVSPEVVGAALRRQLVARLATLEKLTDARLSFRVAIRAPRESLRARPLDPSEFLHGRRRLRERAAAPPRVVAEGPWHVLGLSPGASDADIKRAYRQLARASHPDLHPSASEPERRALERRFSEVTEAYRALVA